MTSSWIGSVHVLVCVACLQMCLGYLTPVVFRVPHQPPECQSLTAVDLLGLLVGGVVCCILGESCPASLMVRHFLRQCRRLTVGRFVFYPVNFADANYTHPSLRLEDCRDLLGSNGLQHTFPPFVSHWNSTPFCMIVSHTEYFCFHLQRCRTHACHAIEAILDWWSSCSGCTQVAGE